MLVGTKTRTSLGIGCGAFLQIVCAYLTLIYPIAAVGIFAGAALGVWGCCHYARGKGYPAYWGLGGFAGSLAMSFAGLSMTAQSVWGFLWLVALVTLHDCQPANVFRHYAIPKEHLGILFGSLAFVAAAAFHMVVMEGVASEALNARLVAANQRFAIKRHPELGVANSPMNLAFVSRYRQLQREKNDLLRRPAWPLLLAAETKTATRPRKIAASR